jgi:SAM-dependent methyltransferase
MSDSDTKLRRLALPQDMTGLSVLDLGCNEGYFCSIAAQRGAKRVLGLDYVKNNLEFARSQYGNPKIEFRHQSWKQYPDEKFDVVIWTSAMHYDPEYRTTLRNVAESLNDNGFLALECGAIDSALPEMRVVKRHGDTLHYPTLPLLEKELATYFDYRCLDTGNIAEGDPIPRYMFHCYKSRPQVLIFDKNSTARDSYLRRAMIDVDTKVLNLNRYLRDLIAPPNFHGDLQKAIAKTWSGGPIDELLERLHGSGHLEGLVKQFLSSISPSDRLVAIELNCGFPLIPLITEVLGSRGDILIVNRQSRPAARPRK